MRQIKKAISLMVTVLVLTLSLVGTAYADEPTAAGQSAEEILKSMSTVEKVSQMIMPTFRYIVDSDGKQKSMEVLTDESKKLIEDYGFAGVIVFAQNTDDTKKAVKFVDDMQKANEKHKTQLLIGIDQEGGQVARLGHGTQTTGNMALGAANNTDLTSQAAKIIGSEIMSMGINFDFAPVLDVNSNPANPVIGIRSFSDDANAVAKQGVAYMKALMSTGAISTLKHFPGHGDTATDSHTGLPSIDRSYDELKARELVPFKAAIDAGVEAIMTAHIEYPQIEKTKYTSKDGSTGEITLPATLSETIITDILRKDLGFEGVVITDSMHMSAIAQHFGEYDAAKLAIEAGVDILLMPFQTTTAEDYKGAREYIKKLAEMVDEGEISKEKVDAAVLRILKLKEKHGLTKPYSGIDEAASNIVGSSEHHETEWEIAKKAITLVKNENNTLPLTGENEKTVVLTAYNNEVLSMEYARDLLKKENKLAKGAEVSVYSLYQKSTKDAIELTKGANHVVIVSEVSSAAGLNNDYAKEVDEIIKNVHIAGGDVTIMSCYLPYDVARFQEADAIVVAYSAKGMSENPLTTEGVPAQYGPNMPAAMYLMLSPDETPVGTLPVNIPKLTEGANGYTYSDEILYQRGFGLSYPAKSSSGRSHSSGSKNGRNSSGTSSNTENSAEGNGGNVAPSTSEASPERGGVSEQSELTDGFSDVREGAWYSDAVAWTVESGIFKGYGDGTFGTNNMLTRAELATVLWRLVGEAGNLERSELTEGSSREGNSQNEVEGSYQGSESLSEAKGLFTDVKSGKWYSDAISWAVANGILEGYTDGSFRPNAEITREQAAAILYRLAKAEIPEGVMGLAGYEDSWEISSWAQDAMLWAIHENILLGSKGSLLPKKGLTRAEAAVIIQRFAALK